jgi:hypothetical protein
MKTNKVLLFYLPFPPSQRKKDIGQKNYVPDSTSPNPSKKGVFKNPVVSANISTDSGRNSHFSPTLDEI